MREHHRRRRALGLWIGVALAACGGRSVLDGDASVHDTWASGGSGTSGSPFAGMGAASNASSSGGATSGGAATGGRSPSGGATSGGATGGGATGGAMGEGGAGEGGTAQGASGGTAGRGSGGRGGTAGNNGMAGDPTGGAPMAGAGGTGTVTPEPLPLACDATLTPEVDIPSPVEVPGTPLAVVSGDWNGDGKVDAASVNADGKVSVLIGSGDGTLTLDRTYGSGLAAGLLDEGVYGFIASGDIDGDGAPDLVASTEDSRIISVFLGEGDGSFASRVEYSITDWPYGITLADLDGDGRDDVAVATVGPSHVGKVRLFSGLADGTLGPASEVWSAANPTTNVAAADLNADGRLDLVVLDYYAKHVLLANGDGTYSGQDYGWGAFDIVVGDFDGDGVVDMNACGEMHLGVGDGLFAQATPIDVELCDRSFAAGDLNGDGILDLVPSIYETLLGNGDGTFDALTLGTFGGILGAVDDWNGDGKLDVLARTGDFLQVHLGNGDGTFGATKHYPSGGYIDAVAFADLDGDAVLDLVVSNSESTANAPGGSVGVLLGAGDGSFAPVTELFTGELTVGLATPDLNQDGWPELVTMRGHPASVTVFPATGNGTFGPSTDYLLKGKPRGVAAGDLNGDTLPDLVAVGSGLHVLLGKGDGTFATPKVLVADHSATDVALLDTNGDAKLDLVTVRDSAGIFTVFLGGGDGTFAEGQTGDVGDWANGIATGDLNGDAKLDLVIRGFRTVGVFLGLGDGTFRASQTYEIYADDAAVADFDGDGILDIVATGSALTVLLGAGDGTFRCTQEYARWAGGYRLALADLNGDGTLDAATTGSGVNVLLNHGR